MQSHLITDFIVLKTQVEKTEKNTHVYLVIERNFVRRHDAPFSFLFYAVNIHDTMGVLYHPRLRIAGAWGIPDDFGYTLDVSSGPNFHRRFSFTSEHVFTEFFSSSILETASIITKSSPYTTGLSGFPMPYHSVPIF